MSINRRIFLKGALLLPALKFWNSSTAASNRRLNDPSLLHRVRPGDPLWPSEKKWKELNTAVNGNLVKIESPLDVCKTDSAGAECVEVFKNLKNPYYIGDSPALTQTSGWLNAWRSEPSVYAVAAKQTSDVVAAVNFARKNNLRLVVKGGGHSYQGTSSSADSLLVWTRAMNDIVLHDDFVARGCEGKQKPQPAVTVGSGTIWMHVYDAVTTKAGRYVQGGGCATVGVAGLIQSGGFGSFSKNYGLAAANLLEAEIVTANGKALIANECTNPDLFRAIKGGGGGSFGVLTKLTLKTYTLPEFFGVASGKIRATSDDAYRRLISMIMDFYHDKLFNPHWGEQISFHTNNTVSVNLVFQGLTKEEAEATWQSFKNEVSKTPDDFEWKEPLMIFAIPAKHIWDNSFLRAYAPSLIGSDNRPNAPADNIFWKGDQGQCGQFLWAYHSAWMPATLLEKNNQSQLADAIFAASRVWSISFHFNKGLAGASKERISEAKNTATNPAVLDAFALCIIAGEQERPAFVGMTGHEPDLNEARRGAERINKAMDELLKVVPGAGSYVSESDFFQKDWQQAFWGSNYEQLSETKKRFDPEGLFFVHHGVGSEQWSDDGFTRIG
jgi:FAD/FMN-containing dehydrogenase